MGRASVSQKYSKTRGPYPANGLPSRAATAALAALHYPA